MDQLRLQNMGFYAYHGNLASEKSQGQRFYVDVDVRVDLSQAGQSDNVDDSINYVASYEIVEAIMTGESRNLLERLGTLIADEIMDRFPQIAGLAVTVRKPSVPIAGLLDHAEITITRGILA